MKTQEYIEFEYKGWDCWFNPTVGSWGAILSRKGLQPIVIHTRQTKEALIEEIENIHVFH